MDLCSIKTLSHPLVCLHQWPPCIKGQEMLTMRFCPVLSNLLASQPFPLPPRLWQHKTSDCILNAFQHSRKALLLVGTHLSVRKKIVTMHVAAARQELGNTSPLVTWNGGGETEPRWQLLKYASMYSHFPPGPLFVGLQRSYSF